MTMIESIRRQSPPGSLAMGSPTQGSALADIADSVALESGPGYGDLGRYSLYATNPRAVFEIVENRWTLSGDAPLKVHDSKASPLDALRSLLEQTAIKRGPSPRSGAIFEGGWIGFLSYDLAPLIERLPRRTQRSGNVPDAYLAYYDTFAIHDRMTNHLDFYSVDRFGEENALDHSRLEGLSHLLSSPAPPDSGRSLVDGLASDFSPDEYCWAVGRVIEYLRSGDIFQANLSQMFSGKLCGSLRTLWNRTRAISPAPFSAMLRGKSWGLVSTSPERFLLVRPDGSVQTRPIKGTRPRGYDPIVDLFRKDELFRSEKDAAELNMIVDLERNDLGRVCEYGSVHVSAHRQIESFANVHHMVSTVDGRLAAEKDFVDLLRATFPGGSITGAPKIRAMEVIDELERGRRGPYTGAIGYISDHGRMDWNVAIRTIVMDDDRVSYRVGGGIVADSDPLSEYRETLAKGRRLKAALLGEG